MIRRLQRRFRSTRMRAFQRQFGLTGRTRILDVGGTAFNWELLPVRPRLTILNLPHGLAEERRTSPNITYVFGDGCRLPFSDRSFDVVFSNSVIEHLGSIERQQEFAREVARVGLSYWVETPNARFPVEQHLLTPFVHFLPKAAQARIVRRFTVWSMLVRPSPDRRSFYLEHCLRDIRLLNARELRALFPDAAIRKERLLGFAKSLIAVRGPAACQNREQ